MKTAFEEILSRRITPDTLVPQHDFLFRWDNQPCFARGELIALTGKAKSGKTYVCSMLMALAVRAQLMGLSRLHDEPLRVVWIDTEQSEDSTHEILCHRIGALINQPIPEELFFVYNLRRDNWQDRMQWVEMCIVQNKPDLVIFDGIRDVVGDINNYTEAQNVLSKMLSLASWSGACIVCVLHQNKALEDKTLRGALGTELQNKSYETYECQKDPDTRIFTLRQTATRKYDITHKLEFFVNAEGLPEISDNGCRVSDVGYAKYANQINAQEIIPKIFGMEKSMRKHDFHNKAMRCFPEVNCKEAYLELLKQGHEQGLFKKRTVGNEVYYDSCKNTTNNSMQELF
jgi:hypothetical protein